MKQDEGREWQEKERNIKYQGMCNVSYFAKAKNIKVSIRPIGFL